MKFTREMPTALMIRSVSADGIRIGDETHARSLALTHEEVVAEWPDKTVAELEESDFDELLAAEPELVIIGTGARVEFAPRELTFAFARRQVGLEVMDTAAAARTFNVLAGEGRRLAAVLYV
ncbi:MAG: MTH938/NDUFAF3 family protein [Woeseiaceae bacterium]|nr:MTH938/NDUFAF3 family protein [Woeseiaceae bacterium]